MKSQLNAVWAAASFFINPLEVHSTQSSEYICIFNSSMLRKIKDIFEQNISYLPECDFYENNTTIDHIWLILITKNHTFIIKMLNFVNKLLYNNK